MLKRIGWLVCVVSILFLSVSPARAANWPASNPQTCTPDGSSAPARCTPTKFDDWQFFDFSGIPYAGVFPGYYPSAEAYLAAIRDYYQAQKFCSVQVSGVTSSWGEAYQGNVLIAKTSGYSVTLGSGTPSACKATLAGTPWIRQIRNVRCETGWRAGTLGGSPICFCPAGSVCTNEPPSPPCDICKGNPVQIVSANKKQVESDYQSSTASGLQFVRTFNSRFKDFADRNQNVSRGLSSGWTATWLQRILYSDAGATSGAFAYRPDGSSIAFYETSSGFSQAPETVERLSWVLDSSGKKIGFKLVTREDATEIYSMTGVLQSSTSRSGILQTVASDSMGNVRSVTDSFGNAMSFQWSTNPPPKRLTGITLPGGTQITYAYNANGYLSAVTYPDATFKSYLYEYTDPARAGLLSGIMDESNVRFATFGYNEAPVIISTEHAGGVEKYTFGYTATTRVVTDPLGTARTYGVGAVAGRFRYISSSASCPGCSEAAGVTYDANGNYASTTDFNGRQTTFVHDLTRNLETTRIEAVGTARARTITTAWNAKHRTPTSITEPNRTTTFVHDAAGNILSRTITDTSGVPNASRTWSYTYNAFGQVLTEDGPRTDVSDVTTYGYFSCTTGSQCGQLSTITNALGHVTTFNSYNAHGQPTQVTNPNGLVISLAYDVRRRVTDRCVGGTLPACSGGDWTHLDYWPTGLLKKVTSPGGSYIQYTYDGAHRLTQINDGEGNKVVYTLDNAGNRTTETALTVGNALKRTHSRVFNSLNQLWKDVNAAGTPAVTTVFGYDPQGNQTTVNAPLGRNTINAYDELNRLQQIIDPNSGVTRFGYDASDNLVSVTDPRSLVTRYTYSGLGDLKTQTSPDSGLTSNTYDSGGNLATSTDARGAVGSYSYDSLNRVVSASFARGGTTAQVMSYTYDDVANGKGHLTAAWDANQTLRWSYDSRGRVTTRSQHVGSVMTSISYGYNAAGQVTAMSMPSGQTIQYGYDTNGQVTSVNLAGSPSVTILSRIDSPPFGPINVWIWGNGKKGGKSVDMDGKIKNFSNPGMFTVNYDDAFRITGINDLSTPTNSWTFGYDNLDRLNSATRDGATIGYSYDANGNRLAQTGTSPSTYTVSGTSNKLSSTSGALARGYSYDAMGNVLSSGVAMHTYDNRGRMQTGRLGAAADTTYVYNALGQRVKKSGGGATTTIFMYDEAGHLAGEYDASGALMQETVWLGDMPVATLRPNGTGVAVFYVHTDHLNTPRTVTDTSNQRRWSWDPAPFGEGAPNENPQLLGAFKYNLRFPGQYFDAETNLNYNYFRDYDPAVGRYIQPDPLGVDADMALYRYVANNPVSSIDPLGLETLPDSGRGRPGSYPKCIKWPKFPTSCGKECGYACAQQRAQMTEGCLKDCKWRIPFPALLLATCSEAANEWGRQCLDSCLGSSNKCCSKE